MVLVAEHSRLRDLRTGARVEAFYTDAGALPVYAMGKAAGGRVKLVNVEIPGSLKVSTHQRSSVDEVAPDGCVTESLSSAPVGLLWVGQAANRGSGSDLAHIYRTAVRCGVIRLVAANSRGVAVFMHRPHSQRAPVQRDGPSKLITSVGI